MHIHYNLFTIGQLSVNACRSGAPFKAPAFDCRAVAPRVRVQLTSFQLLCGLREPICACTGKARGDITSVIVDGLKVSHDSIMWGHEVTTELPQAVKQNTEHKNCIAEIQYKLAHPTWCLHQYLPSRQHLCASQLSFKMYVCVCSCSSGHALCMCPCINGCICTALVMIWR